jgi:hypothetical protein
MPTPDDAMPSPPAEHESSFASRATCPPEDSRIHTPHEIATEPVFPTNDEGDISIIPPTQQPTPPPAERDVLNDAQTPPESHPKSASAELDGPSRDIPTPISATDEGPEEQRNHQVSPLSATAPIPVSWPQPSIFASPFPSHRVRLISDLRLRSMHSADMADR